MASFAQRFGYKNGTRVSRVPFRRLPLLPVATYLVVTFLLFVAWPINWLLPAGEWARLSFYVAGCFFLLFSLFLTGTKGSARSSGFRRWPSVMLTGAAAAIVLLIPSSYYYTGRLPWEVLGALQQQGDTYSQFQDQLFATTGQRGLISIVRAFAAPFVFAVIPLAVLRWQEMNLALRLAALATVGCSLIFSVLRGTDKEFADLIIVAGSAFMVAMARGGAGGAAARSIGRHWKGIVLAVVFVAVAASLFSERKTQRVGRIETACANDSGICADLGAPLIAWMGPQAQFSVSLFILSTCSGYYGLALAMEKDFEPTWGLGHSAFALGTYEALSGDRDLAPRSYTFRNGIDGWSQENYWSTLITWIANDVGFPGALAVLAFLGFAWGRSWRDAAFGESDPAAILFCQLMVMLFYLPANNQVLGALDGYLVIGFWAAMWLKSRNPLRFAGNR